MHAVYLYLDVHVKEILSYIMNQQPFFQVYMQHLNPLCDQIDLGAFELIWNLISKFTAGEAHRGTI